MRRKKSVGKMNTKEVRKYVKKHRQKNSSYVKMKCTRCKRVYNIHTHADHLKLYTPELKKNWVCLICK